MDKIAESQHEFYRRMVEVEAPLLRLQEKQAFSTRIRFLAFFLALACALFLVPFLIYYLSNSIPPMYVIIPVFVGAAAFLFLLVTSSIPTFRIRHSQEFKDLAVNRFDFWFDLSKFANDFYGFEIPLAEYPDPCDTVQGMKIFYSDGKRMHKVIVEVVDNRIIFFSGGDEMEPLDTEGYLAGISTSAQDNTELPYTGQVESHSTMKL